MSKLVKAVALILITLLIVLDDTLSKSVAAINLSECEEAKILPGVDDGVTCNTYHQCFMDAKKSKNTWVIKTFTCPPGGNWDKVHKACVEGTPCTGGGGGGSTTTSGPLTPSPTPTYGPPPFTTPTSGPDPDDTCRKPTEQECLSDPISGPPSSWTGNTSSRTVWFYPGFHHFAASTPIETQSDGSVILQSPVLSNRGQWQGWKYCPQRMYCSGTQFYGYAPTAITYINFVCATPGGIGKTLLEFNTPGQVRPDTAEMDLNACTGPIIGMDTWQEKDKSIRYHRAECATRVPFEKISLRGRQGSGPNWAYAFCGKYQAACGYNAQMTDTSANAEIKGLQTLEMKCCHVPDPLQNCVPTEERLYLRTCDNTKSNKGLRCLFESRIGLSLYQNSKEEENEIIFYSSIGYDYNSFYERMRDKIISTLAAKSPTSREYNWGSDNCRVEGDEVVTMNRVCVKPYETVTLYQIVGRCGFFLVRTNRFVKVIDGSEGRRPEEVFEL